MFINKDTLKEFEAKMAACMPLPVKMSPSTLVGFRRFLTSRYCKRKLLDSLPELRRGETSFWCELLIIFFFHVNVIPSQIVCNKPSFDQLQNVFNNKYKKENIVLRYICCYCKYKYKLTLRFCSQLSAVAFLLILEVVICEKSFCSSVKIIHAKFKFVIFQRLLCKGSASSGREGCLRRRF